MLIRQTGSYDLKFAPSERGMAIRSSYLTFSIAVMLSWCTSSSANSVNIDLNATFGADFAEMPMRIGAAPKQRMTGCSEFFGTVMLTPKALRFFRFQYPDQANPVLLTADPERLSDNGNAQSQTIAFSNEACRIMIQIERTAVVDNTRVKLRLGPDSTMVDPKQRTGSDNFTSHASATFEPALLDCGRLEASFRGHEQGLIFFMSASSHNTKIITRRNKDTSTQDVIFRYYGCDTSMSISFYTKANSGVWTRLELP